MQKLGSTMNLRDERGWMIPRMGTVRRQVYDLLGDGMKAIEIRNRLGLSRPAFDSHRWFIVKSEYANRLAYASKNGERK